MFPHPAGAHVKLLNVVFGVGVFEPVGDLLNEAPGGRAAIDGLGDEVEVSEN